MKSFNQHINDEKLDEDLNKKPAEPINEAAAGDFLIGLGAVGGLLLLKKGWDKFGKGGKLARMLAVTSKQKAQVAKDAEEKRKEKVDSAQTILDDPKAKQKDKDKAQADLDKHQTDDEKNKAVVDKDKDAQDKADTAADAKAIGVKGAQAKFDQSRKKHGDDAQPPEGYSIDPEDKSGKTIIPTADAKKIRAKGKDLDKKITAKGPKVKKNKNQEKPKHGGKKGGFKHGQAGTSKKSQKKAARKAMIKKATGSESFIPYCMSVLSDLTEDFTEEDRTQLLEELVLEETMTLEESNELQAIMALDDAGISAEINKKGQVVVKKRDLKKAEKALKKSFRKGGEPKLVGEHKGTEPHKHPHEDEELDEALKPLDKSVIDAFYYRKEKAGKLVSTDGDSLNKTGMGGQTIAQWLKPSGKIAISAVTDVKSTESILKYMKKSIPKGNFDKKSYKKFFGEEIQKPRTAYEVVSEARSRIIEVVDEHAVRELYLFIENEKSLQRQKDSIIKNIVRKLKSGKYDHNQAPKLWMYLVDNGAKIYDKLNSSPGVKSFDKDTKMSVAVQMANEYKAEIDLGNYS